MLCFSHYYCRLGQVFLAAPKVTTGEKRQTSGRAKSHPRADRKHNTRIGSHGFSPLFYSRACSAERKPLEAYSFTSRRHVRTTATTAKIRAYTRVTSKVCVPSTSTSGVIPMELALS